MAVLSLDGVPPPLRPLVRAYLLGYGSAVAPRLMNLLLQRIYRRRRKARKLAPEDELKQEKPLIPSALHILKTGFDPQRFPTFCAIVAGGTSLLQVPLYRLLQRVLKNLDQKTRVRLSRWLASFVVSWIGLRLLQTKESVPRTTSAEDKANSDAKTRKMAGRTIDLTLFTATRAVDVLVGELWSQRRSRRQAANQWTWTEQFITHMTDPIVFVSSCALIMWAWFYYPEKLPGGYDRWITSAALVDQRLIEALRRCRTGELVYGKETGQAELLGSMCKDYGLPEIWGNPAKSAPFPCELVHMGCGPSCEYHAVNRFVKSWKWSMFTYLPLAMMMQLRKPSKKGIVRAFLSASRSSAFLATYITLFYYGVCLGRTRVGPRILGTHRDARQQMDSGVCVGTGCALCGWSILVETVSRRKDMALFVAPRALSTVVARQYPLEKEWRETLAFAASSAVVFTCVLENPRRVRGVLGAVLSFVMRQ